MAKTQLSTLVFLRPLTYVPKRAATHQVTSVSWTASQEATFGVIRIFNIADQTFPKNTPSPQVGFDLSLEYQDVVVDGCHA